MLDAMPDTTIEYNDVIHFLRLWRPGKKYDIVHGDSPDFTLNIDGKIIGIEHSRVIPESNKGDLQQRSIKKKVAEIVEARYRKVNSGRPLDVDFLFNDVSRLHKKESQAANQLYELLIESIDNNAEMMKRYEIDRDKYPDFLYLISYELRPEWDCIHRWDFDSAGWVSMKVSSLIQGCIEKKNKKYSKYKHGFDRVILLLVSGHDSTNFIHPDVQSLESIYQSKFSETFFLDKTCNFLHKLKGV
jgi:hypothetical protein